MYVASGRAEYRTHEKITCVVMRVVRDKYNNSFELGPIQKSATLFKRSKKLTS
jgi:hypothetical protein